MGERKQLFRGVNVAIMAPANETLTANPAMNVPITENLTVFNNTTLKPVGEDNEDMLNVVLVPVLIMALMISIAAIIFFVVRKRSAAQQRLQFVPMYSVDREENNEWESQLMDEGLSKHTHIVKPSRRMDAPMIVKKTG